MFSFGHKFVGDFRFEFHIRYISLLLFCLVFTLSIYYFNKGKKWYFPLGWVESGNHH